VGYAVGASDLCAAGIGAPHIRQRIWWGSVRMADSMRCGQQGQGLMGRPSDSEAKGDRQEHRAFNAGWSGGLVNSRHLRWRDWPKPAATQLNALARHGSTTCGLGNTSSEGSQGSGVTGSSQQDIPRPSGIYLGSKTSEPSGLAESQSIGQQRQHIRGDGEQANGATQDSASCGRPSPPHGFWRDADWLHCRDGKWRPVEPGTFPLAHGIPARVVRLRGYGNAIVPQVAAEFIQAFNECLTP
jgi:DNA (cytosine-5)-methyltransferase 1